MPSTSSNPSIALVGVGNWGRHILRDLVSLGCDVHAVARSDESIERAREHGATSIVSNISELPACDGAVVATLASHHADAIEEIAQHTAGPIFTEKPLTADVAEAERLVAALPDRLFVMDKWRYHAGILELKRLAGSGELGELQGIALRRVSKHNPHEDVNTLWTHAWHDYAITLEILGEIPPLKAATGEFVGGELHGATAILGEHPWVTVEVSDCAPDHRRESRVVGSEGAAILDGGWSEHLTIRRFGQEDQRVDTQGELPLLAELRAFVEHIAGGPAPKSSAAEGLMVTRRIQELSDAAVRAAGVEL